MSVAPIIAFVSFGLANELSKGGSNGDGSRSTVPVSPEHLNLVGRATRGLSIPCGAPEVDDHGVRTKSFQGVRSIQKASLASHFGLAGDLGGFSIGGAPKLSRECCIEWLSVWQRIAENAMAKNADVTFAKMENALEKLSDAQAEAQNPFVIAQDVGSDVYIRLRNVMEATSFAAASLDSAVHLDLDSGLPSNAEILKGSAQNVGDAIGGTVAFGLENLLLPIAGAGVSVSVGVIASVIAPYLILGGATWYAIKVAK